MHFKTCILHDCGSINFEKEIVVCKMNVEIAAATQTVLTH